jgi:hypothetical protein
MIATEAVRFCIVDDKLPTRHKQGRSLGDKHSSVAPRLNNIARQSGEGGSSRDQPTDPHLDDEAIHLADDFKIAH